jgi:cytochrome c oxidase subunit 3
MDHHTNQSGALNLGVTIFLALAVMTVVEFFIAISLPPDGFATVLLLVILAVGKAGMVLYYYMHISKLSEPDENEDHHSLAYKTRTNRLGLWLFLLSDSFLFGGLAVVRFNLLGISRPDLENQLLGLAITSVLLLSSFFMNRAEMLMANGDRKGFLTFTALTLVLGIGFLIGVVGVEWQTVPFGPEDRVQGAVFFMMTGMHAFHVLTGVIFLSVILRNGLKGLYTPEKHFAVEAAAVYWHFVDVVWIFFYPALYLIGRMVGG